MLTIEQEILERIRHMSDENKQRVLEFTRIVERPKGESGKEFLARTAHIRIDPEDLAEMARAIEEENEKFFAAQQSIEYLAIPGEELIARAHAVSFDPADVAEIAQAIQEGYNQVDDKWEAPTFSD
jgi:intracellular sulfur oxidation DsrE/DsrF family protein